MKSKRLINILLCASMLILPSLSFAAIDTHQTSTFPKKSIYFELLGNGGLYSLNYERFLKPDMSIRIGASYLPIHTSFLWSDLHLRFYSLPVLINFFHGSKHSSHKFETGIGLTAFIITEKENGKSSTIAGCPFPTASIGYRYVPKKSGMTFKASFTPFFFTSTYITPLAGLGIGYNF